MYSITVKNSDDALISGAFITLTTISHVYTAITDGIGECTIDTTDSGQLVTSAYRYETDTTNITDAAPAVIITMPVLAGSVVCGRVTDLDNNGVSGVEIEVTNTPNLGVNIVTSDINGMWISTTYGRYVQVIDGGDTVDLVSSYSVTTTLYIVDMYGYSHADVNWMGILEGHVVDESGDPVDNAKISLDVGADTYTNASGWYYFILPSDTFTVSVDSPFITADPQSGISISMNRVTYCNFITTVAPTSGIISGYVIGNLDVTSEEIKVLALRFTGCSATNIYVWIENPYVDVFSRTTTEYDKNISSYGIDVYGDVFPSNTVISSLTKDDLTSSLVIVRGNNNWGLRIPDVTVPRGSYADSDMIALQIRSRGIPVDDADYRGLKLMVAFDTIDNI